MGKLIDGLCAIVYGPVTVGCKNWLFADILDETIVNTRYLTIVEMEKTYDLNLYEYRKFPLEYCSNENMSDEEFEYLSPWIIVVQEQCGIK